MLLLLGGPADSWGVAADLAEPGWDAVPGILAQIQAPDFPDRDFLITDFGAIGDGSFDCHPAFEQAIAACVEAKGGRVVVPAGRWFVRGPLHLFSNVNLHLQQDSTIAFSTDPQDYLPMVLTRFEGTELMNYSP